MELDISFAFKTANLHVHVYCLSNGAYVAFIIDEGNEFYLYELGQSLDEAMCNLIAILKEEYDGELPEDVAGFQDINEWVVLARAIMKVWGIDYPLPRRAGRFYADEKIIKEIIEKI